MSITHAKVSAKSDGGDATLVLPSDWNASHVTGDPIIYVPVADGFTAIQTAIDALPAGGGIIQLGPGDYTTATGNITFADRRNITIRGVGGPTGGSDTATTIRRTGTGSGSFIIGENSVGCGLEDLEVLYTNAAYTGRLIDISCTTGSEYTAFWTMRNVLVWGVSDDSQTSTLLYMNRSLECHFERVKFNGGGIQVHGRKAVPISDVSVASPTEITTSEAHGYSNGDSVYIGGTDTSATLLDTAHTVTVTAGTTFTVPVNVAAVTTGTGYASCNIRDWMNVVTFADCEFINADVMPIRNMGESWNITGCNFEYLNSGDIGLYTHDAGMRAAAVRIEGCWLGDQTTTNTTSLIYWGGWGLSLVGNRIGGRSVSDITVVEVDENDSGGIFMAGNTWPNITTLLDIGATTGFTGADILAGPSDGGIIPVALVATGGTMPSHHGLYDASGNLIGAQVLSGGGFKLGSDGDEWGIGSTPSPKATLSGAKSDAAPTTHVADTFTRSETDTWGTAAPTGGAWTLIDGTAGNFDVGGATATMVVPADDPHHLALADVSAQDFDVTFTFSLDALPSTGAIGLYTYVRVSGAAAYTVQYDIWSTGLTYARLGYSTSATPLTSSTLVPGLTAAGATDYTIRFQCLGINPTVLRTRIWLSSGSEPTAWHAETTDTANGPQASGAFRLNVYLSAGTTRTVTFDDLTVTSGPTALADLIAALVAKGIISDNTTA